jgi:hypothetical protein
MNYFADSSPRASARGLSLPARILLNSRRNHA